MSKRKQKENFITTIKTKLTQLIEEEELPIYFKYETGLYLNVDGKEIHLLSISLNYTKSKDKTSVLLINWAENCGMTLIEIGNQTMNKFQDLVIKNIMIELYKAFDNI